MLHDSRVGSSGSLSSHVESAPTGPTGRARCRGAADGSGNRLDGDVGNGLPVGSRSVGTPRSA